MASNHHHHHHHDQTQRCGCGAAIPDGHGTCESCLNQLSVVLSEMTWLQEQLEVSISKQHGAATTGGTNSGETALPWNDWASRAQRRLTDVLTAWVRRCARWDVRHSSPVTGLPKGEPRTWTIETMGRWLMWRVDGLAAYDEGRAALNEIGAAAEQARKVVTWKRLSRVYLGPCDRDDCTGEVYAEEEADTGSCTECARGYSTDVRRAALEAQLDARLCTAAEVARLSTFLGLDVPRDQVRKRVNQWHKRKLITPKGHDEKGDPLFRYGEVRGLLARESDTRKGA